MINAIDLRIGNWVNREGKGFIKIMDGRDLEVAALALAEPIPITASLLEGLGFAQRDTTEIFEFKGSNFYYHLGVRRVALCHPGNELWHWLGSHIDYVHQIQNLYYCIIGQDLPFNLNNRV
jgi:hypothetical protein